MLIQKQKIKALFLYALLKEITSNKAGKTKLDYDKNGNLKTDVGCSMLAPLEVEPLTVIDDSEKYRKKYLWNYENQLMKVAINKKNSNDTFTVAFAYNGDGQRIYKETSIEDESGNETKISAILYVRNSFGETIEEHSLDLTSSIYHLSFSYVFGNGKRIMSIASADSPSTTASVLGSRTYYLSDILGSNSLLTNDSGTATMLTKYDEFGNTYYQWEDTSHLSPLTSNYLYTGKPFDREIGLYYYGARYYNPEWGRWVSRDSFEGQIDLAQSLNRYLYVDNNPINYLDPNGNDKRDTIDYCKASIGIKYKALYNLSIFAFHKKNIHKLPEHLVCNELVSLSMIAGGFWKNYNTRKQMYNWFKNEKLENTSIMEGKNINWEKVGKGDILGFGSFSTMKGHVVLIESVVKNKKGKITAIKVIEAVGKSGGSKVRKHTYKISSLKKKNNLWIGQVKDNESKKWRIGYLKEEILRLNQEVENYKILIEAFNPILNSLKEERRGK